MQTPMGYSHDIIVERFFYSYAVWSLYFSETEVWNAAVLSNVRDDRETCLQK